MNRLTLYKDKNFCIYGGIITNIKDVKTKGGKSVYIVTLKGTTMKKEGERYKTEIDYINVYFSNAQSTEYRSTQLYDRIKKTGIKLEQYLIVKAERSKKYENIAFAKDFNYINHTFTLKDEEKKRDTNILIGMVKEIKEFESCIKITMVQNTFLEGKHKTLWPTVTIFKDSNKKIANVAVKLLKADEEGRKYAAFICGENKPYKGNACYIADTFEVINITALKNNCCSCDLH